MTKKKGTTPAWQRKLHGWWQHKWVRWATYVGVSLATILVLIGALNTFVFTPVQNPIYGVSFSVKEARNLKIDWEANYTALLDDLQFKHFRLMSYWDESEINRGQFNFDDLDWQFKEAAKRVDLFFAGK